ncbi:hypothetical protein PCASD_25092 [Puccinia coronata f. sp. avenae]|uniref:Uncharacterized protein n=1 Tax=Puccinia coronata f. sp. avenae TaxID=200324 RepID=A0A2N5SLI3_9BASI|nr:hypothetical protein PCASD_25092 [Puccinia coronata f. sp. avenae]
MCLPRADTRGTRRLHRLENLKSAHACLRTLDSGAGSKTLLLLLSRTDLFALIFPAREHHPSTL